ncbi:MAG: rRNA maturation RNase YbeY [Treponema sp.]|jgi:probable rRNA maturation factor|nr:rRNA maturation RNase YbeY [Treponema sp.]
MNRVALTVEEAPLPVWSGGVKRYALKALDAIGRDNWDLSIMLCGDKTIQALNARYRGKDEATDVLSFELGAEESGEDGGRRYLPGDIVISLDTLRENALYFQTSEDEELRRLLIHGILHLDGMDHRTNDDTEPMIVLQERILARLKEERILTGAASAPVEELPQGGDG